MEPSVQNGPVVRLVTDFSNKQYVELASLEKYPSARIIVNPEMESKMLEDPRNLTFIFNSITFCTHYTQYQALCCFTDAEVTEFAAKGEIKAKVYSRLEAVAALCDQIEKGAADQLASIEWKHRMFGAMAKYVAEVQTPLNAAVKIKRIPNLRYGLLCRAAQSYVNLNVLLCQPSFKVLKIGVELNGKPVVIAKPNKKSPDPDVMSSWNKELAIWRQLIDLKRQGVDLSNILVPLDILEVSGKTRVVFEKKSLNLVLYMMQRSELSPKQKVSFSYQAAKGLHFVHAVLKCTHRDFKPDNIVLDESGTLFLTDWGFVRPIAPVFEHKLGGTLRYVPPEILKMLCQKFHGAVIDSEAWDAWNLGITLHIILYNCFPDFVNRQHDRKFPEAIELIQKMNELPEPPEDTLEGVMRRLLRADPAKRWKVAQALAALEKIYLSKIRYDSEGESDKSNKKQKL